MRHNTKNPFLNPGRPIKWSSLTSDAIVPDITLALSNAQSAIDSICAIKPGDHTFDNTVRSLEDALLPLNDAWSLVCHLSAVKDSKELRTAHNTMLPKISDFSTAIPQNTLLWNAIKSFSKSAEGKSLSGIRKRLLDESIKDFKLNGADLPAAKKARLRRLNAELTKLTRKFSENVLDSTNAWELVISDENKIKGLPESAKAAAWQSAEAKGLLKGGRKAWRFTLQAPSYFAIMKYLEDESIRRQAYEAQLNVGRTGKHNNLRLIRKTLALRHDKARLLGFRNFADLVLKRRMAGSGTKAMSFIDRMHSRTRRKFCSENAALADFAASASGTKPAPLPPWSIAYWAEKMRLSNYNIDSDKLRAYFGIDDITSGLFRISERLFGIRICERPAGKGAIDVWDDGVKYYEIHDAGDDRLLGTFYMDLYPRESKRSGAWLNPMIVGGPKGKQFVPHISAICGNLTPPVGDCQARITHDEMVTLFHEFGHLMHSILSEVEFPSLASTNVAWDFVELPSQLLENWCWHRKSLRMLTKHVDTGKCIDDATLGRMLKARNFRSSSACTRQISFAKMDLELHVNHLRHRGEDLDALHKKILKTYLTPSPAAAKSILFSFQHIFSDPVGYAAAYYSYKWAQCLEADVFTRFARNGILDSRTGMKLRKTILSKGNSKPAEELFRDFMGRDPDPEALLKRDELT